MKQKNTKRDKAINVLEQIAQLPHRNLATLGII